MMQEDAKYIRRTIQLDKETDLAICNIADLQDRSFSYVCSVLLKQALKEKNRKRRGKNEKDSI